MKRKVLCTIIATSAVLIGCIIAETAKEKKNAFNFNMTSMNMTNLNLSYKKPSWTRRNSKTGNNWLFKDYLMRFNPNVVFDRIDQKKKKMGLNASVDADFDEIFKGIDPTDDLLSLNVEAISGRRKWKPPGRPTYVPPNQRDLFSLRMRLFDLIRHTIYQTRNRMVIMQIIRAKYRDSPLYKMGYLISRTDVACKDFHAFAYRVIHACPNRYLGNNYRFEIISMLHAEERLNNKWFEIELLIDLINKNHENAQEVLKNFIKSRKENWKFID